MNWPELDRGRWAWARRARALLLQELGEDASAAEDTRLANVMVVGDTQAGKTTLLVRLLGVSDPELAKDAEDVLRAGRPKGNSATALPIRYRWSVDRDLWQLVRGPGRAGEWLTSDELRGFLIEARSQIGGPLSHPFEIGLPRRLRDDRARDEVRVLDLPGLSAAEEQERETAQAIVARFAPVMKVVVFVHPIDKMTVAQGHPLIRDNPHLSGWARDHERFRIVFTKAFYAASFWPEFARRLRSPDEAERAPASITRYVREKATEELVASLLPGQDKTGLSDTVFPIDIGDSWRRLCAVRGDLADLVRPANELFIEELRADILEAADEASYHIAWRDVQRQVEHLLRRRREDRERRLDRCRRMRDAARDRLSADERITADATAERDRTRWRLEELHAAIARLSASRPAFARPPRPEMKGHLVRDLQEDERAAWCTAAAVMWRGWAQETATRLPGCQLPVTPRGLSADIRAHYDQAAGCCQVCHENWVIRTWRRLDRADKKPLTPESCYEAMSRACQEMSRWVPKTLAGTANGSVKPLADALEVAEDRLLRAIAMRDDSRGELDRLDRRLRDEVAAATEAEKEDARHRAAKDGFADTLSKHGRQQFHNLLQRLERADTADRGWFAVAALRTLKDLQEIAAQ